MRRISIRILFGFTLAIVAITAMIMNEKEICFLIVGGMLTYINPKPPLAS